VLDPRTATASDKVAPLAWRYVDALEEDLANDKLTYCRFAEADKTLAEAILTEAEPLRAELVSSSR